MSGWFRGLFLFSSFGPLYLLLAVELAAQKYWKAALMTGVACLLSAFVFLKLRSGFELKSPSRQKVRDIVALDENILTYLITYLPPFMVDDFSKPEKLAPSLVFYVVMVLLMLGSETIYVNPYFILFRYRIYRVSLPSSRQVVVVTKKNEIVAGDLLNLYEIQPSRAFYAD